MTDTWWFNLIVTLLIIAASGFFVVIEFSLMGSRRNRLEENAESSRTARAGLMGPPLPQAARGEGAPCLVPAILGLTLALHGALGIAQLAVRALHV